MSSSDTVDNIEISNVTIKSSKVIALIKVSIGTLTYQNDVNLAIDKLKEATSVIFNDIIKVHLEGHLLKSKKTFKIKSQDLLSNASAVDADPSMREYRTTVNEIEAVIRFLLPRTSRPAADLRPTTDKIFELCPRFRVLVIGRTGAGKTSLIKHTFAITGALVSCGVVGECNINDELYSSDENKRFVLHDSKGFEPGDEGNFDTVLNFLNERKEKPDIKDYVHAVWLCFSIPLEGDRLFETGTEIFLQSLSEGKLGKMPIIAIFTKYDKLVDYINIYGDVAGPDDEKAKVTAKLNGLCVKPFKEQFGNKTNIPDISVSTGEGYEWTLHELTRLTTDLVRQFLSEDIAVLSAVAQQVNPTLKLEAVIAVGKKGYWQGLASAINLPGNEPEIVLQNIHKDIVTMWNLQDPTQLLDSNDFKKLVASIVSEPDVLSIKKMGTSLSMLGALTAVVTAVAVPAAPIVLPIAAVLVISHWTLLLLKQAGIALQRVVTYIIALTLIMQIIFVITTTTKNTSVVSRRLIKVALKTFLESSQKGNIQSAIQQHFQRTGQNLGREAALHVIVELLSSNSSRISAKDMAKIKNEMKDFDINNDEPW